MIDRDLVPGDCREFNWGHPSGHAHAAICVILLQLDTKELRMWQFPLRRMFLYLFSIVVVFSRLYLAAHSIPQLIMGGLIGYLQYY